MLGSPMAFLAAHVHLHVPTSSFFSNAPMEAVEGWRAHDPHLGMNPATYALVFGIVSGLSLPLGAAAGIYLSPVHAHWCALMMAFGAGALLFAVTVELYAHALREVEKGRVGLLEMFTIISGALLGAAFYLTINQWLKDQFPESEEDEEVDNEAFCKKELSERSAIAKAAEETKTKALKKQHKEHEESAPLMSVLDSEDPRLKKQHKEHEESAPLMSVLDSEEKTKPKRSGKALWQKVRQKKSVLGLLSSKGWSYDRPREKIFKAAYETGNQKGLSVALGIFLGLLVDGVPEGILMGFLSAEGHLTPVLIISLFVANLPEAFASGSLMVQAGVPTTSIMGLWTGLCLLVGCLCGLSCYLLLLFFPSYGVGHTNQDVLPTSVLLGIALVEGITGGAMIACISAVMLPEAFARSMKNLPFWNQTGFMCSSGFLMSVALKTLFG